MPVIRFESKEYICEENESILQALTRHGVSIPHSCQSGLCQTCLMRSLSGKPTDASQAPLKPNQQQQNYFLACSCYPTEDMEVSLPDADTQVQYPVDVISKELLSDTVIRLRLSKPEEFEYQAGQFINVHKTEDVSRSYSLASLPSDPYMELHVRHIPGGVLSGWLYTTVNQGDELKIGEAMGTSFYVGNNPEAPLLLIGTGTGLAPLVGIARDAIAKGHKGEIWLYHGVAMQSDLYLHETLMQLDADERQFHYVACVSKEEAPQGGSQGRANNIALEQHKDLKGWQVFLCGNPNMVEATRKSAFLAGANFTDIFTDPFKFASS